jgi:hypothetical protein
VHEVPQTEPLSQKLKAAGFYYALGTYENYYDIEKNKYVSAKERVKKGEPYHSGYNNGVTVVYDEEGRPWVKSGFVNTKTTFSDVSKLRFDGAYVPHSNDGGHFMKSISD